MQGTVIAGETALATSTTESANKVQNTYDYIGAGTLHFYAKSSAASVYTNLFINGVQVLRKLAIPFTGTAGTLSTSDNLITSVGTLGGRVELTFQASTGTPTVDYLLTFEALAGSNFLSRLVGRRR